MKTLILFIALALFSVSCSGPGGPATRTGRTVDRGVEKVGQGVERTGEKIQDIAR